MSVRCLSEWVRWLEKKSLSLLISQPTPGLWGLFSPRVLLLAQFLPLCHRQRLVLLTWVEAWPVPFWQSALSSHEDLGTSVFNVEIPPPSVETFFFFWQTPLGHVTHIKFLLKGLTLTVGFLSLMCHCGCHYHNDIGLRHIAILKLVGTEALDMGGVLELYPINGKNLLFWSCEWNCQMCVAST